jgi:signal transduction histidine kinase
VEACAGHPGGGPFDLRVRDANGRWRTLEVVVRGYVDEPGVGAVAYLGLDVTAQRADERALREEVARLKAGTPATTADASFVPTVAHELRGPLSSVVAFAHLLGDPGSGELTEDQRTYLDVIDRNANRLLRLIEELLLLSRLQMGRLPLHTAPVPVATLIEPVISDCQLTAEAAGLSLTWDCVDGPELKCDEARIQQVLNSLVANALKFTPPGGRISVAAFPTGAGWQLTVTDTGIGLPADEQPKLFSPFFRASNVGAGGTASGTPGAGLGLMISQAIVELHDGEIEVASTEGVGTTVTVTLPETPAGPARSMKDGGRG